MLPSVRIHQESFRFEKSNLGKSQFDRPSPGVEAHGDIAPAGSG
jgi:hypothetical protein